jgi:hypothetical protein
MDVPGRTVRWWALGLVVLSLSVAACGPLGRGAGPRGGAFRATGFFRTTFDGHRWWLVSPDGRPFYSTGINHVSASDNDTDRVTGACPYCQAVADRYPTADAWTDATVRRLRSWGFNTIGSWSDVDRFAPRMPYTALLGMASGDDWFSDAFAAHAASIAADAVARRRDDPNLIGWVTDSELRWGPDWRGQSQLLDDYEQLPPGSPGRAVADRFPGDPIGFLRVLADRYFRVTTEAIHAQDPHHLILGVKQITQLTPPAVLEAARRYVDVFSVDDYALTPGLAEQIQQAWPMYLPHDPTLSAIARIVGRPLMVMEYSFRAADAGLPNSYPPIFPVFPTQQARTDAFADYAERLYSTPWFVGDQWFEYVDEPAGGRFDGEDSNFGLVSVNDVPWTTLVTRMTQVHARAPDRLAGRIRGCWSWQRAGHDPARCGGPASWPPRGDGVHWSS